MNTVRLLAIGAVCVLAGSAALARDLKTINGEVYKNITVAKQDATGLVISHDDGVIFIDFLNLDAAEQKEFGYDPAAYAAGVKQKAEADKARREQAAIAARARAQAAANAAPSGPVAATPPVQTNQTGVEFYIDSPGFSFGPYDYARGGFSNVIPPRQGGPVPYPNPTFGPYPYYYGPTWGPTIIRRR